MGGILIKNSKRLDEVGAYLFSTIGERIREVKARGGDVISLGIGDPDMPTPSHILEELIRAADDSSAPDRHRYGSDWPSEAFPDAIAHYYGEKFGVNLDPRKEVLPLIGSKEGIGHVAFAFLDRGDVALFPEPGYPVCKVGTLFAGGEPYVMPLIPNDGWIPDFDAIPTNILKRAKLMWLNYPNNPTAAVADLKFFERAVEFARSHNILICHDAAYIDITFDGYRAPSMLEIDGAKDQVLEFYSLSKPFNMTGWRVAAAVGNSDAVKALGIIKDNLDSGIFRPIQMAGTAALMSEESHAATTALLKMYKDRRDFVVDKLTGLGWKVPKSKGTFYIWAPIPDDFEDSLKFATMLLEEAHIAVTPGGGYGPHGEGYFRISLTTADDRLKEAMERLEQTI